MYMFAVKKLGRGEWVVHDNFIEIIIERRNLIWKDFSVYPRWIM